MKNVHSGNIRLSQQSKTYLICKPNEVGRAAEQQGTFFLLYVKLVSTMKEQEKLLCS